MDIGFSYETTSRKLRKGIHIRTHKNKYLLLFVYILSKTYLEVIFGTIAIAIMIPPKQPGQGYVFLVPENISDT